MGRSVAAQVIIAVIPIVGIVMGSVVVFFYLLWNHKHKMLLIQTNQWEKPTFNITAFSLLAGLLLSITGISLTILLALIGGANYGLLGGLLPLSCGIALLVFFIVRRHNKSER
ncbi:MAG: hypothetical protein Ta2F_13270 [Termitinemataceae bacterium]|nr:MAG: hypothetical protein Ta2F_13270 [Termitinemataceae bacterium]